MKTAAIIIFIALASAASAQCPNICVYGTLLSEGELMSDGSCSYESTVCEAGCSNGQCQEPIAQEILPWPGNLCDWWTAQFWLPGKDLQSEVIAPLDQQKTLKEQQGYSCEISSEYVETQSGHQGNPTITPYVLCCMCEVTHCPIQCVEGETNSCLTDQGTGGTQMCEDYQWGQCKECWEPGKQQSCVTEKERQGYQFCQENNEWGICQECWEEGQQKTCTDEEGKKGMATCKNNEWSQCAPQKSSFPVNAAVYGTSAASILGSIGYLIRRRTKN